MCSLGNCKHLPNTTDTSKKTACHLSCGLNIMNNVKNKNQRHNNMNVQDFLDSYYYFEEDSVNVIITHLNSK